MNYVGTASEYGSRGDGWELASANIVYNIFGAAEALVGCKATRNEGGGAVAMPYEQKQNEEQKWERATRVCCVTHPEKLPHASQATYTEEPIAHRTIYRKLHKLPHTTQATFWKESTAR